MVLIQFTTLSVGLFFIIFFSGGFFAVIISLAIIAVWPMRTKFHRKVIIPIQDRLTQITERRARERAPQARDVTTEIATAPGEFYP